MNSILFVEIHFYSINLAVHNSAQNNYFYQLIVLMITDGFLVLMNTLSGQLIQSEQDLKNRF